MKTVNLKSCVHNKDRKYLVLQCDGRFPKEIVVKSDYTGKEIVFKTVQPGDPLFCEDQWDGEQQIYRPTEKIPTIEYLTMFAGY